MGDLSLVEETLKRISSYKGILGSVIINGDGIPVRHGQPAFDGNPSLWGRACKLSALQLAMRRRSTFSAAETQQYAAHVSRLTTKVGAQARSTHRAALLLACETCACTCRTRSQRRKVHASKAKLAVLHRPRKQ